MRLRDSTIRTWFFIHNIDQQYQDFVRARKKFFCEEGLTEKSHFIASTGIEGSHILPSTQVPWMHTHIQSSQTNLFSLCAAYLAQHTIWCDLNEGVSYRIETVSSIISGTASIIRKEKSFTRET